MTTVALDVGQSGVRASLDGASPGRDIGAPGTARWLTDADVATSVGERLVAIVRGLVDPPATDVAVERVLVGLSGYDPGGRHAATMAKTLGTSTGAASTVVASDAVAWFRAVIRSGPGIVAALGTGSVVFASDGITASRRLDGWGHFLGDLGGGFAIGRAGLMSAVRASEGRRGSQALLDRVLTRHGSIAELAARVYGSERAPTEIAGFAEDVAALARDGDAEARRIWHDAGRDVGSAIVAAHRALFDKRRSIPVWLTGGLVSAADLLTPAIIDVIGEAGLEPAIESGAADSLIGVSRLSSATTAEFGGWVVEWHRP